MNRTSAKGESHLQRPRYSTAMRSLFLALAAFAHGPSLMGQTYDNFSWVVKRNGNEVTSNPSIFINEDHLRQDLQLRVFNDQSEQMWVHLRLTLNSSPGGNIAHTSNSATLNPGQSATRTGFIEYTVPENSDELAYTFMYTVYLSPHQDPNEPPLDHLPVKSESFVFQRLGGGGSGD